MSNRLIIFDLDGVIIDSEKMAAEYMIERYPHTTLEMAREYLVENIHEVLDRLERDYPQSGTKEEKAERAAAYSLRKLNDAGVFAGIPELLGKLHDGRVLVLNTSSKEKNCIPLLEKHDLLKYFDLVAAKETSPSKIEKFKIIEERYKISNDETIFITDTLGDLREANKAGIRTVAVTWGAHDHTHFTREENPNLVAVVDTVAELEKVITE